MNLPVWEAPQITDTEFICQLVSKQHSMGSDTSHSNLFLLRHLYHIEIAFYGDFLLRHYNGTAANRNGYGFPLGSGNISEVLDLLKRDSIRRKIPYNFCLLDSSQKQYLESNFPGKFFFREIRDDSDYLYQQSDLAFLKGKNYHKKKNHVSRFYRLHPEYHFEAIQSSNFDDAFSIALCWFREHYPKANWEQNHEICSIMEALDHFEQLQLTGFILYVKDIPAAMTLASPINPKILDVHFEKSYGNYAINGAYAAINQHLAQSAGGYTFLNREEDIGLPGLRAAKLSYHPVELYRKYTALYMD